MAGSCSVTLISRPPSSGQTLTPKANTPSHLGQNMPSLADASALESRLSLTATNSVPEKSERRRGDRQTYNVRNCTNASQPVLQPRYILRRDRVREGRAPVACCFRDAHFCGLLPERAGLSTRSTVASAPTTSIGVLWGQRPWPCYVAASQRRRGEQHREAIFRQGHRRQLHSGVDVHRRLRVLEWRSRRAERKDLRAAPMRAGKSWSLIRGGDPETYFIGGSEIIAVEPAFPRGR